MLDAKGKIDRSVLEKLSVQEQQFVIEYCKDLNPVQAVARLGFDELIADAVAVELLAKDYVQEAIAIRLVDYGKTPIRKLNIKPEDIGVTEPYIVLKLKNIADFNNTVNTPSYERVTPQIRLKALEMLGKHIGMWKDVKEDGTTTINLLDDKVRNEIISRIARNGAINN